MELYHHGIKGMKWGVRRYQNPDGTRTSAGLKREQKKAFKSLKKSYRSTYDSSHPYSAGEDFKKKANQYTSKIISDEDKQKLIDAKNKRDQLAKEFSNVTDFYDSKEFEKWNKKAFDETLKWFENNDKTYLNEIVKKNGGKKDGGLLDYHDFRKTNEGYQGYYWDFGEREFYKTPEGKKMKSLEDKYDQAHDNYRKECANISKKLLGEYGNQKLSKILNNDLTYNDLMYWNVDWDQVVK